MKRSVLIVVEALPDEARTLDLDQRSFLAALVAAAGGAGQPSGGDDWQATIFSTAAGVGLPPGRAFAALYLAFLGRPNGPRAGWLLASLDRGFVAARLREAAAADATMSPAGGGA